MKRVLLIAGTLAMAGCVSQSRQQVTQYPVEVPAGKVVMVRTDGQSLSDPKRNAKLLADEDICITETVGGDRAAEAGQRQPTKEELARFKACMAKRGYIEQAAS